MGISLAIGEIVFGIFRVAVVGYGRTDKKCQTE